MTFPQTSQTSQTNSPKVLHEKNFSSYFLQTALPSLLVRGRAAMSWHWFVVNRDQFRGSA
jgi:hypothetical protein